MINEDYDEKNSSIAKLCRENNENVISGPKSLGSFIESHGYDAMPSPSHPKPGKSPSQQFKGLHPTPLKKYFWPFSALPYALILSRIWVKSLKFRILH